LTIRERRRRLEDTSAIGQVRVGDGIVKVASGKQVITWERVVTR